MLKAAEFAPGKMKFAGHAEIFHAKSSHITCRFRKMVIAPAAGRKALKLQVCVEIGKIALAAGNVSVVMKNAYVGFYASCSGIYSLTIPFVQHFAVNFVALKLVRIHAERSNFGITAFTPANARCNNIKKYTDRTEFFDHFFGLRFEHL